ncbi:MAG: LysM peptidoglycan-binding domain-containing protein [Bacteroidota bacterium]
MRIIFYSLCTYLLCTLHVLQVQGQTIADQEEKLEAEEAFILDAAHDGGYGVELIPMGALRGEEGEEKMKLVEYHIVQKGQTLYRISQIYDVSVKDLMLINELNSTTIFPGQKIRIRTRIQQSVPASYTNTTKATPSNTSSRYASRRPAQRQNMYTKASTTNISPYYKVGTQRPKPTRPMSQDNVTYYTSSMGSDSYQGSGYISSEQITERDLKRMYTPASGNAAMRRSRYHNFEWGMNRPRLRSVHIGISRYDHPEIPHLKYARNDAEQFQRVINDQRGKMFSEVSSSILQGKHTTYQNIAYTLKSQAQFAGPEDLLLLTISGHAIIKNGELRILPSDYRPNIYRKNYLTSQDILHLIQNTPARVLVVLDVCFSEQAGYDFARMIPDDMKVSILVSSRKYERSAENKKWQHGAFTRAFLEGAYGFADINQDRLITLTEMLLYIQARVRNMTDGEQHANIPINFLGDIPIFRL